MGVYIIIVELDKLKVKIIKFKRKFILNLFYKINSIFN